MKRLLKTWPLPSRCCSGMHHAAHAVHTLDRTRRRLAVAPVVVAGLEGLLDQQPAEARAVDEQLAGDAFAVVQRDRVDETALGILLDADHLAFGAHNAARLGVAAQEARVEAGVEVVGVGDVRQRRVRAIGHRRHEAVVPAGEGVDRIIVQRRGLAGLAHLQPILVEGHHPEVLADLAEAVDVAVTDPAPVHELDAELERAHGLADERALVQVQRGVVELDHRDRRLAHADDADLLGLHEPDRIRWVQYLRQRRRGHPPGSATADDHDLMDAVRRRTVGRGVHAAEARWDAQSVCGAR